MGRYSARVFCVLSDFALLDLFSERSSVAGAVASCAADFLGAFGHDGVFSVVVTGDGLILVWAVTALKALFTVTLHPGIRLLIEIVDMRMGHHCSEILESVWIIVLGVIMSGNSGHDRRIHGETEPQS